MTSLDSYLEQFRGDESAADRARRYRRFKAGLRDESRYVRDKIVLRISRSNDPAYIPLLEAALERETIERLRERITQVIAKLRALDAP